MNNYQILEAANEREFTLTFGGIAYPAKLYGAKLDYPIIATSINICKHDVSAEISWTMAKKIATGEKTNVQY